MGNTQFPKVEHKNQAYKAGSFEEREARQRAETDLKRIIMGFDEGTQGLMVNALVPTGEEGRNKLRKASESCK